MLALVLLAAAQPAGRAPEFEEQGYMTEGKARAIAEEPLPESQASFDRRLKVLKGKSYLQLGRIERMIPLALLGENGDVTVAEAIPGIKRTKPLSILECTSQLEKFTLDAEKELNELHNDTRKLKGTVVDFQLIDDMKTDPSHPWVHSATFNKTSVSRKMDAVTTVLQSWVKSLNTALKQAANEYVPPFNMSLAKVEPQNRPPPAALAWIEQYTQSSRIVLVAAGLLKKFSARGMAEGLRLGSRVMAVPLNVKDWLDTLQLAAGKVAVRARQSVEHERRPGGKLHKVEASFIEEHQGQIEQHYTTVGQRLGSLTRVVMREKDAMKQGFLPKASALLLEYGKMVQALNDASNATRTALKLPPSALTKRVSLGEVYESILRGEMADHFYGKKLGANQTLEDWGLTMTTDHDGHVSFASSLTQSEGQKQYHKLREDYESRTPGYTAFDTSATNKLLEPQSLTQATLKTPKLDKLYEELTHQHAE